MEVAPGWLKLRPSSIQKSSLEQRQSIQTFTKSALQKYIGPVEALF